MTETDFIFAVSQKLNISYKEANDRINAILDCIKLDRLIKDINPEN